jgi:hypothetical protein
MGKDAANQKPRGVAIVDFPRPIDRQRVYCLVGDANLERVVARDLPIGERGETVDSEGEAKERFNLFEIGRIQHPIGAVKQAGLCIGQKMQAAGPMLDSDIKVKLKGQMKDHAGQLCQLRHHATTTQNISNSR